jgi:hypothetical protein
MFAPFRSFPLGLGGIMDDKTFKTVEDWATEIMDSHDPDECALQPGLSYLHLRCTDREAPEAARMKRNLMDRRVISVTRVPRGMVLSISRYYPHNSLVLSCRWWPPYLQIHWGQPGPGKPWLAWGTDLRLKNEKKTL